MKPPAAFGGAVCIFTRVSYLYLIGTYFEGFKDGSSRIVARDLF